MKTEKLKLSYHPTPLIILITCVILVLVFWNYYNSETYTNSDGTPLSIHSFWNWVILLILLIEFELILGVRWKYGNKIY